MRLIPFEELYHTDFFLSEAFSKYQNWYSRGNIYASMNRPKPSHTLLWFKNCRGVITESGGKVIEAPQGCLMYMAKGIRYTVEFFDTCPGRTDTIVIHFQMKDAAGEDIAPTLFPEVCLSSVDVSTGMAIEMLAEEFRKNVVCIPETDSVIYRILASICQSRRKETTDYKYACIRSGIDLLEQNSDRSIAEIARSCGVSECYFRRLFREYSGESPIEFRQRHRVERAKQLLLSDMMTVGEIAQELNFSDIYHFSKTFKQFTGMSPSGFLREYKDG